MIASDAFTVFFGSLVTKNARDDEDPLFLHQWWCSCAVQFYRNIRNLAMCSLANPLPPIFHYSFHRFELSTVAVTAAQEMDQVDRVVDEVALSFQSNMVHFTWTYHVQYRTMIGNKK